MYLNMEHLTFFICSVFCNNNFDFFVWPKIFLVILGLFQTYILFQVSRNFFF